MQTIPARNAAGSSVQTVIMGNQLVRLATSNNNNINSNSNSITTVSNNNSTPITSSGIASSPKTLLIGAGAAQTLRLGKNVLLTTSSSNVIPTTTATAVTSTTASANNLVFAVQGNGGQLFFTPGLQGVNLKPFSSMKVIPMSTATTVAGSGVKLSSVSATTVDTVAAGKTMNSKLLPTAVIKTASGGGGAGHGN